MSPEGWAVLVLVVVLALGGTAVGPVAGLVGAGAAVALVAAATFTKGTSAGGSAEAAWFAEHRGQVPLAYSRWPPGLSSDPALAAFVTAVCEAGPHVVHENDLLLAEEAWRRRSAAMPHVEDLADRLARAGFTVERAQGDFWQSIHDGGRVVHGLRLRAA